MREQSAPDFPFPGFNLQDEHGHLNFHRHLYGIAGKKEAKQCEEISNALPVIAYLSPQYFRLSSQEAVPFKFQESDQARLFEPRTLTILCL